MSGSGSPIITPKVGRSIRLDKQLEQLLAKQKQEEQSQADEVGVQLPSFRKLSPDAGSEPECHVSNNNFATEPPKEVILPLHPCC